MLPPRSKQIAVLVCLFSVPVWAQTIIPGGLIDTDTTWTVAGSPYLIQGNVLVTQGTLLTMEPAVAVQFSQFTAIVVSGRMVADGTVESPIQFQVVGVDHSALT